LISFPDPAKFLVHQDESISALTNLLIRSKVVPCMGMWSEQRQTSGLPDLLDAEIGGSHGNTDSPPTHDEPSPPAGNGGGYTDERNSTTTDLR
jgi:hypothetical protein